MRSWDLRVNGSQFDPTGDSAKQRKVLCVGTKGRIQELVLESQSKPPHLIIEAAWEQNTEKKS
jgi:hypothetical protein